MWTLKARMRNAVFQASKALAYIGSVLLLVGITFLVSSNPLAWIIAGIAGAELIHLCLKKQASEQAQARPKPSLVSDYINTCTLIGGLSWYVGAITLCTIGISIPGLLVIPALISSLGLTALVLTLGTLAFATLAARFTIYQSKPEPVHHHYQPTAPLTEYPDYPEARHHSAPQDHQTLPPTYATLFSAAPDPDGLQHSAGREQTYGLYRQ